jgi:hypothetical protein
LYSRTIARAASLALLPVLAVQCEGIDTGAADASAEASKPPVYDAALPDVVLPTCGDAACTEPPLGVLAEAACCLPSGECGLRSLVLDTACLPRAPTRGADLACPPRSFAGGNTLGGCCGADGRCGLLDSDGELGCVSTAADAATCVYDPNNDCTSVIELPCDGPEDCDTGKVCCGRAHRDRYDAFGCFPACDGIVDDHGGFWVEICHPRHFCQNPRFNCEPDPTLPSFLARCREPAPPLVTNTGDASDADVSVADASVVDASVSDGSVDAIPERNVAKPPQARLVPIVEIDDLVLFGPAPRGVGCGDMTCAEGEKCCLRTHALAGGAESGTTPPIDPYCARGDGACSCVPSVDP